MPLTLTQRFAEASASIYGASFNPARNDARTQAINSSQPFVYIRPNTTSASPGVPKGFLGSAFSADSNLANDTRSLPFQTSAIRDARRLFQFIKSPAGTRFLTTQALLQFQNPYARTALFNPFGLFASAVGSRFVTAARHFGVSTGDIGEVFSKLGVKKSDIPSGTGNTAASSAALTGAQTLSQVTVLGANGTNKRIGDSPLKSTIYGGNVGYFPVQTSQKRANALLQDAFSGLIPSRFKEPTRNLADPFNNASPTASNAVFSTQDTAEAGDVFGTGLMSYKFLEYPESAFLPLGEDGKHLEDGKYDIITFSFQDFKKNSTAETQVVPFRAFISSIRETVKPEFQEQQYIGRTERLVTYVGAKRSVNLEFHVVAFAEEEIQHTWSRINYLTGLAFPKGVSAGGFMIPPLFRINIGKIYKQQPCYIDNLEFEFLDEKTTFDILEEVSQVIKVTATLQLIEKTSRYGNSPFYKITEDLITKQAGIKSVATVQAETVGVSSANTDFFNANQFNNERARQYAPSTE